MIQKDLCTSAFCNAADGKFFGNVIYIVATLSWLRSFLPKPRFLKPAAIPEEESRQNFRKTYFAGEEADLFHCEYTVLGGFADASKFQTKVLNVLERPPSVLVKSL